MVCQGLGSALGSGAHLRGQGGDQFGCFNRRTSFRLQHFSCENRNTIGRLDDTLLSPLRQIGDLCRNILERNRGVVVACHPFHQFFRHEWKAFLHLAVQTVEGSQAAEKRLVFTVKCTIIDDTGIIIHHIAAESRGETGDVVRKLARTGPVTAGCGGSRPAFNQEVADATLPKGCLSRKVGFIHVRRNLERHRNNGRVIRLLVQDDRKTKCEEKLA